MVVVVVVMGNVPPLCYLPLLWFTLSFDFRLANIVCPSVCQSGRQSVCTVCLCSAFVWVLFILNCFFFGSKKGFLSLLFLHGVDVTSVFYMVLGVWVCVGASYTDLKVFFVCSCDFYIFLIFSSRFRSPVMLHATAACWEGWRGQRVKGT